MSSPPHDEAARTVATTGSEQSRDSPGTNCGNAGSTLGPALLGLGLILAGAVAGPVVASPDLVAFDHAPPDCDGDGRDRRLEERAGQVAFVDTLVNDSKSDWDGGQIVRVGSTGDCSLAVTNGTAALTAATVDETGVLTGTVDLGENGSLRLVGPSGTTRIAFENEGPAYATSVAVITNGSVRDRVETPTGRFFEFTLRRHANGTARLAVWGPDEEWDGNWDVRLDGATAGERWRVGLSAEAFVDEIAIGTQRTSTPTETEGDPFPGEDSEFSTPGFADSQFDESSSGSSDDGPSGGGAAFFAVIVMLGGGLGFRFAYALSQFEERIDAIGSTTPWHEVEPADWKVFLNRIIFGGIALLGALWLLTILL